jgi:hypothetical protein
LGVGGWGLGLWILILTSGSFEAAGVLKLPGSEFFLVPLIVASIQDDLKCFAIRVIVNNPHGFRIAG